MFPSSNNNTNTSTSCHDAESYEEFNITVHHAILNDDEQQQEYPCMTKQGERMDMEIPPNRDASYVEHYHQWTCSPDALGKLPKNNNNKNNHFSSAAAAAPPVASPYETPRPGNNKRRKKKD